MSIEVVMRSPQVLAGLSVREGLCGGRAKTRTSDPPGGGDDLARSREPEIQDRRSALGSPRQGRPGEGLFEIHHRRREAVVIDSNEATEPARKITNREPMNLLPPRGWVHSEGCRGHDAASPLGSHEHPIPVMS